MIQGQKPLISVVIPAYNEEKYLPDCLSSFRAQTFSNFELIVVDNNSTDKTANIARLYGAKVIKEKIQGMVHARERGFKEAKAEIIARTDADTLVSPNWLEVIYESFKKNPQAVALTGTWLSSLDVKNKNGKHLSLLKNILNKIAFFYAYFVAQILGKLIAGHTYLLGPNMAVKKSAWRKVHVCLDDNKVPEDADLSCHLSQVGDILYIPSLKVTGSVRKIIDNPQCGLYQYFVKYTILYIRMLSFHKSQLKQK